MKQTQHWVSFIASSSQNGSFQILLRLQFINRSLFRSSTIVMNSG